MNSVLITGAGGFLGRHLCELFSKDYRLIGADLPDVEPVDNIEWKVVDTEGVLAGIIRNIRPDIVVHAAFPKHEVSDLDEDRYIDKVVSVNLQLFKAIVEINARLLLISSSAVYGHAEGRGLIREDCPLRPITLYGLAKVLQETMAQYYSTQGLNLVIARLFNLVGPGQKCGMLFPDWVSQALDVCNGKASELKIRHRRSSRDFVDVRDAAGAILLMSANFESGEIFNVSSGRDVSLMDVSRELERICPIPLQIVETESEASKTDVLSQHGSFDKIESAYGWRPTIDWRRSLKDLWDSYGA